MKSEDKVYPYTVNDFSSGDALILAPHPDDESIGCGGSILRHKKAGSRVKVIFLTSGDAGDFEKKFGREYVNIRLECTKKALDILKVDDYEIWGYKDRNLHLSEEEASEKLSQKVSEFSPDLIYAPSPFEIHPDHRTAFSMAWRLHKDIAVKVLLYETLVPLYPNVLVNITDEWFFKKQAIESYRTELYYNNYSEKAIGLNRFRTATLQKDIKYAEAFILVKNCRPVPEILPSGLLDAVLKASRI